MKSGTCRDNGCRSVSISILLIAGLLAGGASAQGKRVRDHGIVIWVMRPGPLNAITDVAGVKVGQVTIIEGDSVRTGVTAVLPHGGNVFRQKVPAAIYVANGFGKLAGLSQVEELGTIETPVVLTNTLSVPTAADALITWTLANPENADVQSVNPVAGETNDGWLNDIRGRHVTREHVLQALREARDGPVAEGCVGAGTGTVCFGYKGGIGTASRKLPPSLGGYTVGVLVQTNFGGVLEIAGVPVGRELKNYPFREDLERGADGSCMIVVATDAPLDARNLKRLARRAVLGLGKTGGICANGSGDYVIAFSTDPGLRVPFQPDSALQEVKLLRDDRITPLFLAVIEATEEAILNSLFTATTTTGRDGHKSEAIPLDEILKIMKKYNRICSR